MLARMTDNCMSSGTTALLGPRSTDGLPNRWVSRVVASKYDEGTVFVSLTRYREDDFEAYLYRSNDFDETWKSIVKNMPSESINVIREDPTDKDIL